MPSRAKRLLYILLSALAAVLMTGATTPATHALADSSSKVPAPYIIVVDPGHGGSPNNNDPNQLFDPGAIGVNGVLEKDVTLDVSQRLATLLRGYNVDVVLTRTTDKYMSIDDRSALANAAKADLFVSVHEDSFTDGSAAGSLVLYPNDNDLAFATTMANSVGQAGAADGISNVGPRLDDNWWIHLNMPACTVESAYLSNPQEAALLATEPFRQTVAQGILNGLLAYQPDIARRSKAIDAALKAGAVPVHRAGTPTTPVAKSSGGSTLLRWLLLIGLGVLAYRKRAVIVPLVARGTARGVAWGFSLNRRNRHTLERRRRRATVRARILTGRAAPMRRPSSIQRIPSVYDELQL